MSPVAGPLFAAALLLGSAGLLKITAPNPTRVALRTAGLPNTALAARLLGAVEVAIALFTLAVGGRLAAGLITLTYLGFAGFSLLVIRTSRGKASCGCFGDSDAPLTHLHVGVDLAIAAVAAIGIVNPVPGLFTVAADTPLLGIPFLIFTGLLAWLVQVLLIAVPELQAAARPPRKVAR